MPAGLTPNAVLTQGAIMATVGTDTSVYVGPCRLVGAWVNHTSTTVLSLYDATSTAGALELSIRCAANNTGTLPVTCPAGIKFEAGIHGSVSVLGAAAFVAYVPL